MSSDLRSTVGGLFVLLYRIGTHESSSTHVDLPHFNILSHNIRNSSSTNLGILIGDPYLSWTPSRVDPLVLHIS